MISLPNKSHLAQIARTLSVFLFAGVISVDPLAIPPADANGLGSSTYLDGACNIGDSDPANHLSPETAFVIDTVDKLWEVTDCSSTSATVYFRIDRDLDASDANFAPTSSPIGYSTSGISSFSGVLNGGGFQISVSMATNHGVALFALLEDAEIKNLILQGSYSTSTTNNATSNYSGALAVRSDGHVTISSVANQAAISGYHDVGGLIGRTAGSVSLSDVENSGIIQGGSYRVGGLIGYALGDLSINSSRNSDTVSALGSYVGGFVGQAAGPAEILDSENSAPVVGKTNNGGGFVGGAGELQVSNSTNSGTVTGNGSGGANNNFGGFVGIVTAGATLSGSQNLGEIRSRKPHVGGLIGKADGPITFSFSINRGAISGTDYVGGLVGRSTVRASFTRPENRGTVTGTGHYTGGLAGFNEGYTELSTANNSGSIFGADNVGGFMGFARSIDIFDSLNSGSLTAGNKVGGFIGASDFIEVSSSSNQGDIAATGFHVGGIAGEASSVLVSISRNEGRISALNTSGGLLGAVFGGTEIFSSSNNAEVSGGGDNMGGLIGYSGGALVVGGSSNLNSVSGLNGVGGLLGYANADSSISFSYNTGAVSGSNNVGGIMGSSNGDSFIHASYNAGLVSGATNVDGILGLVSGLVTTHSSYTAVASDYLGSTSLEEMKLASTFIGYNFDSVWGFGTCSDNNSLPMLRGLFQVATYFVYSCGLNAAAVTQAPGQIESPAPVYSGPVISGALSAIAGTEVTLTGNRLESVTAAHVGGVQVRIVSALAQSLTLDVPSSMASGSYDLVLQSNFGTLTIQNGLTVLAPLDTSSVVEATAKKLTVVAFKGYVAIYTKGYEDQRLSAKVAGKWLVVDSLDESWRGYDYSRSVRYTGAGYDILVHLYIDGQFVKTEELTTR
jgi:hypothetical protein